MEAYMKRFTMAVLLSIFCVMQLHGEVKVVDEMPYVENKGIRLYADVGKKHSIEIADPKQLNGSGEWWTVRAYVQNACNEPVRLLLGRDSNVVIGFPDSTTVNVAYEILNDTTVGDMAVKPPVGDLRLVELEPGEVAQLPVANVQLKEREKVSKMRITYAVDGVFEKWFKVWSGDIALVLDKNRPPSR